MVSNEIDLTNGSMGIFLTFMSTLMFVTLVALCGKKKKAAASKAARKKLDDGPVFIMDLNMGSKNMPKPNNVLSPQPPNFVLAPPGMTAPPRTVEWNFPYVADGKDGAPSPA